MLSRPSAPPTASRTRTVLNPKHMYVPFFTQSKSSEAFSQSQESEIVDCTMSDASRRKLFERRGQMMKNHSKHQKVHAHSSCHNCSIRESDISLQRRNKNSLIQTCQLESLPSFGELWNNSQETAVTIGCESQRSERVNLPQNVECQESIRSTQSTLEHQIPPVLPNNDPSSRLESFKKNKNQSLVPSQLIDNVSKADDNFTSFIGASKRQMSDMENLTKLAATNTNLVVKSMEKLCMIVTGIRENQDTIKKQLGTLENKIKNVVEEVNRTRNGIQNVKEATKGAIDREDLILQLQQLGTYIKSHYDKSFSYIKDACNDVKSSSVLMINPPIDSMDGRPRILKLGNHIRRATSCLGRQDDWFKDDISVLDSEIEGKTLNEFQGHLKDTVNVRPKLPEGRKKKKFSSSIRVECQRKRKFLKKHDSARTKRTKSSKKYKTTKAVSKYIKDNVESVYLGNGVGSGCSGQEKDCGTRTIISRYLSRRDQIKLNKINEKKNSLKTCDIKIESLKKHLQVLGLPCRGTRRTLILRLRKHLSERSNEG